MYDMLTRNHVIGLLAGGRSLNSVSKETGISRSAIRAWQTRLEPRPHLFNQAAHCSASTDTPAYAYLLGLYLGDGCISPHPRGGHHLRIACADAWPGLIEQCVAVTSYGRHWTCMFPQHGPGKKHERRIVLEDWQQEIVDAHPWEFLRGLIHSDGCRVTNWTVRNGKRYEYPRYFFTNRSDDIRRLCTDTLTKVGVRYTVLARGSDPFNVSVARKESVALMDAHIGPKH
ncbi:transcriptional regulator [Streptomyces sp. NPDC058279]|uniref:transcriptional regulator n=1 Tax=Streptomyces sp. NPDC058279 TaxID=3346418 RepID=UPI0036E070E0